MATIYFSKGKHYINVEGDVKNSKLVLYRVIYGLRDEYARSKVAEVRLTSDLSPIGTPDPDLCEAAKFLVEADVGSELLRRVCKKITSRV